MSRVITVHFISGEKLRLHGSHVPTFMDNYREGVDKNRTHFYSGAKDKIMINMANVTFVEEHDIDEETKDD